MLGGLEHIAIQNVNGNIEISMFLRINVPAIDVVFDVFTTFGTLIFISRQR
jgi:hypothetical protein